MVKLPKIIYESTAAYHGAFMKKYSGDWEMNWIVHIIPCIPALRAGQLILIHIKMSMHSMSI